MRYRHIALTVAVSGREVHVAAHPARAARSGCGDELRQLLPGETAAFDAGSAFDVLD